MCFDIQGKKKNMYHEDNSASELKFVVLNILFMNISSLF